MKLGEIKLEALSLMYPDIAVRYDDSDENELIRAVYELEANPNFEGALSSSVSSVNRALAKIEDAGLSMTKCVDFASSALNKSADGRVIIEAPSDFYSIERVLRHKNGKTYACGYEMINGAIRAEPLSGDVYTLVYKIRLPRVKKTTPNSFEIDLCPGISEAIPYFVASELMGDENSERAKEMSNTFALALERAEKKIAPCHECFQIIYSVVDL